MKLKLAAVAVMLLGAALIWVIGEGLLSIFNFGAPSTSLAYSVYARFLGGPSGEPQSSELQLIRRESDIEALLPDMREAGVALGNSPYNDLKTEEARIGTEKDGCLLQKPNLRKEMGFLRSTLFGHFDSLNVFYTVGAPMPDRLREFIDKYSFRKVAYSTDENGYRITVPAIDADRKVLVAGASIANGLMLDDSETLTSQMQQRDRTRQYVNIGIGAGGKMKDIVCSLQRAEKKFAGKIDEVVFILGEIQQDSSTPYGTADELIPWLSEFAKRNAIRTVDFVYIPYILNSVPDVTRRAGDNRFDFPFYNSEKQSFIDGARKAGFKVVDFLDATNDMRREAGTQFAPLIYYVDLSHLSKIGTAKLVDMLTAQ